MVGAFSPLRLKLARRRRRMRVGELADAAGCSRRHVSDIEKGKEPSREVLSALSSALGFSAAFFYQSETPALDVDQLSFRARSSMPSRVRDHAASSAELGVLVAEKVEQEFELPDPNVLALDIDPEVAAARLRSHWGIGDRPISNMIHLLEANGIRVFSLSEEHSSVDGFSYWWEGQPYVFLNAMASSAKSGQRGRFDAGHELGHLVLHGTRPEDLFGRTAARAAEAEANRFASAFLMPASSVEARVNGNRRVSLTRIFELKHIWNVSAVALVRRLWDLNLIGEEHFRRLSIQCSRMGLRTKEKDPMPRERSQVWDKVFRVWMDDVELKTFLADLAINRGDLAELVFGAVVGAIPTTGSGPATSGSATKPKPSLTLV